MAVLFGLTAISCGKQDTSESEKPSSETSTTESSTGSAGVGDDEYIPRQKQTLTTIDIVDKNYDYGNQSSWAGDAYTSEKLGYVNLQDVIDDYVYDWGHSIIKDGDTYKMWWVRPAVYDAIFYAESKDLKNWYNLERVICYSPNAGNITKYDNLKGMLGKPSVIKVNDTYYMYFEAPSSEDPDLNQTVLEWDNQVLLATSKNGTDWQVYSDEKGQPQPVIKMPEEYKGNYNSKNYGVGQPSVFYKDGKFYLTYCYVIYSENIAEMRVAESTDGINFGEVSTHQKIYAGNGLGVTYNEKTGKYMMAKNKTIVESDQLNFTSGTEYTYYEYDDRNVTCSFPEFVKNQFGIIDTETFYVIHLQGEKSTTSDWREGHTTWNGYIHAVNPAEYQNRKITLPNGGAATENNLKGYRDSNEHYSRPTADAVYVNDAEVRIDGEMDEAYAKADKIVVSRPVYAYGSDFSDNWAEAYFLWNEDYLYFFAKVYDNTLDTSYGLLNNSLCYMHDSIDVFVDVPNDHGTATEVGYSLDQYMICTDANNTNFIIKDGDENDISSDFGVRKRVKKTNYGYAVEWRVSWFEFVASAIKENKCIGLDISINDAKGNGYGREAMVVWSDHRGESFRYLENFGDIYLIKK